MRSARGFRVFGFGLGVLALGVGIPAVRASIIDIDSNAGSILNEYNMVNGIQNPDEAVTVSPSWAPIGMGYEWVSYAATGCNTFVVQTGICTPGASNPAAATGNITLTGDDDLPSTPTAAFYNTFDLPAGETLTGSIDVWADDTARVYINGHLLIDANPNPGSNCASGPVGCLPNMDAILNLTPYLTSGSNTLTIDAYQYLGGSPFGVMYDGSVTATLPSDPTPEPASYVLMGLGLVVIGILIPRARRA
jgi:hypothetical protein